MQTHLDLFEWGKVLTKLLLCLRSSLLHKIILVLLVLDHRTVSTYQVIAVETVDLHLLIVIPASWRRGLLDQNLLRLSFLQLLQACHLVSSKYFQFLMALDAFLTNELSAVSTESGGLTSRALFTEGLHFSVGFLHLSVELLHAVDKESRW